MSGAEKDNVAGGCDKEFVRGKHGEVGDARGCSAELVGLEMRGRERKNEMQGEGGVFKQQHVCRIVVGPDEQRVVQLG